MGEDGTVVRGPSARDTVVRGTGVGGTCARGTGVGGTCARGTVVGGSCARGVTIVAFQPRDGRLCGTCSNSRTSQPIKIQELWVTSMYVVTFLRVLGKFYL